MSPKTSASVATAWLIVFGKPTYPLYVWALVGANVRASLWTLAAWPLFAALPWLARRSERAARAGLVVAGLVDTVFSTFAFGQACGVEAFFVPCAALAALSFTASEAPVSRALTVLAFAAYAGVRYAAPPGFWPWPPNALATLRELNFYSAAALTAFAGWRFAAAGS